MDFNKTIFENRQALGRPFLAAHRGVCGGNIPCNTIESYKIALMQGADVVEIDVTKSKDGKYYVFHPGMEHVFLGIKTSLSEMTSEEIDATPILNPDKNGTKYRIPKLSEVFALLKDKVYINVDKYWMDIEGITAEIRKAGVEKQVIVKTYVDDKSFDELEKFAPDLMYMTMAWHKDEVTEKIAKRNINHIGIEVLFNSEDDEIASDEYIKTMHEKKLLLWSNGIVYNERDVLSAHHSDDVSMYDSPENGWGWLIDKNFDFIQTDWLLPLKLYINNRKN